MRGFYFVSSFPFFLVNPSDCCTFRTDADPFHFSFLFIYFAMIISPYYRFVFIAVPKTGTTSIENRLTALLSTTCPNPTYVKITTNPTYLFVYKRLAKLSIPLPAPSILPVSYKHEPLSALSRLGPSTIKSYRAIAFVRNPWDRLVSQFKQFQRPHFLHHEKRRLLHEASLISFEAFVRQYIKDPRPMWKLLVDDTGSLAVDFVGRFESLAQDFSTICSDLNLPSTKLDHLNPGTGEKKHYRDYYSSDLLEIVNPVMEKDAALFGYSF